MSRPRVLLPLAEREGINPAIVIARTMSRREYRRMRRAYRATPALRATPTKRVERTDRALGLGILNRQPRHPMKGT